MPQYGESCGDPGLVGDRPEQDRGAADEMRPVSVKTVLEFVIFLAVMGVYAVFLWRKFSDNVLS